ncbi:MAG: DUF4123 domain-containing protein [Pseudomonas sp.]|uniref:DUF4123 domain-containing protein n=1 Tax=Pseudomonas sp. TaxID=306 RepID=UPI00299E404D|nr:DUF4123 domain-containing protein [Pseudomonas sp.]MDX1725021.1 DUF4123 domain-containing protein [Pseudomonas sp.]
MWQEQPDYLNAARHEQLPVDNEQFYILLDGALLEVPTFAYTHDHNPTLQQLYAGTRHSSAIEVSPCLVQPSSGSGLWAVEDKWRHCGIVIQSDADIHVLAGHLRSLISMRLPSGQLAYCRFYAPSWLNRLLSNFTEGEFSAFSGPVQRWFAYDQSTWLSLGASNKGQQRLADDDGWFCLRQDQLDLLQTDEKQRFIERMAVHFDCPRPTVPEGVAARERMATLVQQARILGFDQEYQCTHYLELAWRFPEDITAAELKSLLNDRSLTADTRLEQAESRLFGLA